MPTYKFKNTDTEEEFQEFMSMKEVFSRISESHPNSPLSDRFGSSQTNKQKKIQNIGKKHGLVRKDGGQNVSKLTNTYKTT